MTKPTRNQRAERAAAAEAELAERYPALAGTDLQRLADGLAALRAGGCRERAHRALADAAHDLKGQGATFGYALAGRVAERLYRYLEDPRTIDAAVVGAHVDALERIIRHRIAGEGGALGRELLQRLDLLVVGKEKTR